MSIEIRTEAALQALIGESESIELEFKGPDDFLSWPQSKQNITKDLSKEVSAFANTYGGQIVIGIRETRDSPRRAEALEGVDPRRPPIETIQRIIESNIRPRLEGIRYQTIQLSGTNTGRVAYVITVPQGKTVHQAPDKLYYGRSEYESVPLEDQLIRYKIVRERVAEATINVVDLTLETAAEEYGRRVQEWRKREEGTAEGYGYVPAKKQVELGVPPRTFDRYSFALSIKNTGPITIRDCLLKVRVEEVSLRSGTGRTASLETQEPRFFRMANPQKNPVEKYDGTLYGAGGTLYEEKIFPGQEQHFPGTTMTLDIARSCVFEAPALIWTLYLEDSPPISGSIRLRECFSDAINAKWVEAVKRQDVLLGESRRIAQAHPENVTLRKQLAEALFDALNFAALYGALERWDALLGELRQLGDVYRQDEVLRRILEAAEVSGRYAQKLLRSE